MFIDKHTSSPAWDCATLVSGMAITLTVRLDPRMDGPVALVKAPPAPPPAVVRRGVNFGTPVLSFPLSGAITVSAVAFFGGPR